MLTCAIWKEKPDTSYCCLWEQVRRKTWFFSKPMFRRAPKQSILIWLYSCCMYRDVTSCEAGLSSSHHTPVQPHMLPRQVIRIRYAITRLLLSFSVDSSCYDRSDFSDVYVTAKQGIHTRRHKESWRLSQCTCSFALSGIHFSCDSLRLPCRHTG